MQHRLSTSFIFIFGALGGLLFGFDTGIISGASPLIETNFSLNIAETGFITSSVLIGSSLGALSIGPLADRYGRRKLLILAAILFLVGSSLSMVAMGFVSMVIARIILGLAVGSASALTPAYLAELAPADRRGSLGTMFQLMVTLGILLAYVSNLGFLHHNLLGIRDWRWMLGSALIPAAALLIGGLLLPESPRFLVEKGKVDDARNVLKYLRQDSDVDPEKELNDIQSIAHQQKGGLKELFTVARPAVIVAVGIMLLQQLVGINSVIYFLPQVFIKGFGFAESSAIWISVGIGIVNFLVTIIAYSVMDKFDRKKLLIFGSIVMAVSLGILAVMNFTMSVQQTAVPTMILIAIYIFGFAISWGPIAWVMIGEIFPLSVRGVGSSIGSAANWIGNFIVSQFFLVLLDAFNNNVGGPFAIFGVFSVLSIFFVHYLVPETRGKSLEQIELDLRHAE
ncbi:sugar porter family MFS transporter [Levilactobacillus spicheri]|uniref:MFS transporter n=2 Tax=Levilactobacillus spicheri TaxID=216463 RepID=A0ABQ0WR24_9LACO|nr:sugar porter family MFS transporter [Levilactobacillus spicheri]KRL48623.1 MFS family major facilitator transporter [Levilactobacillus spicheri DSM 15429]GEO66975.1 MFS transporter [Levilactobacillus spicheri]